MADFQINHPNPIVRMQEVLAAAIEMRDRPSDVPADELAAVLTSAETVPSRVKFRVAQALLRRPDMTSTGPMLDQIVDLAVASSANPEVFQDPQVRGDLVRAIRNVTTPDDSPGGLPGTLGDDRKEWATSHRYSPDWGIPLAAFTVGLLEGDRS
jgi:hypothetical protein